MGQVVRKIKNPIHRGATGAKKDGREFFNLHPFLARKIASDFLILRGIERGDIGMIQAVKTLRHLTFFSISTFLLTLSRAFL